MNFYISDLHFNHTNIIKYDNRPFQTADEMNHTLIKNWNKVVTDNDIVNVLGDFVWGKFSVWEEILPQLNGEKILIKGNHDKIPDNIKGNLLKEIVDYKLAKDPDTDMWVIMSHYPMPFFWRDYDPNVFMLCGHLHVTKEHEALVEIVREIRRNRITDSDNRGQLISVECCQPYMNYTPKPLSYLINCLDTGVIYGDK